MTAVARLVSMHMRHKLKKVLFFQPNVLIFFSDFFMKIYSKCPKISKARIASKMANANSADQDQSAPSVYSLHCLPFH